MYNYRILNFTTILLTISEVVVCETCKSRVKFTENGMRGLGFKIVVSCEKYDETYINSCPLIDKRYEINRRIILSMRLLGIGLNFCMEANERRIKFSEHSLIDAVKETRLTIHRPERKKRRFLT